MQPQSLDQDVVNLAKAIRQTESGGNFNARGKSGEYGAYQFMPSTWTAYAREAGVSAPFGSATPDQQNEVAYKKIKQWKDQGYNVGQIASMWNAGPGKKNAYLEGNKGKYTRPDGTVVEYDTKDYAEKVAQTYQSMKKQGASQAITAPFVAGDPSKATNVAPTPETLSEKLSGRLSHAAEGFQQPLTLGGVARGLLRVGGAIGGGVGDVVASTASALTPDFIEKPVMGALGGIAGAAMETAPAQGLISAYQNLDPEIQKDLGDIGNIASLIPIGKAVGVAGQAARGVAREAVPTALKVAAKEGGESVIGKAAKEALEREALEVVAPKMTAKTAKQGIKSGRGQVGGIMEDVSVAPDEKTIKAAKAAAGVVNKRKTMTENANLVRKEIANTATTLEKDLSTMDITPLVTQKDLDGLLTKAMKEIGENPTLVGDAERSAKLILNKFKSFLPKGQDITAVDILRARKKLDRWIDQQSVGNVFNPNYETAKTISLRYIRQGANQLVSDKAPDVAVKEALARQSSLYDALENISAKATSEVGTNGLERFIGNHPRISGLVKYGSGVVGTGLGLNLYDDLFGK